LIEAAAKRNEREHFGRVWLAWHVAAFHRVKKLPKLEKLLVSKTTRPRQTWRQQLAVMEAWAAAREKAKKMKEISDGR
jgi:phosphohistidine phosphatase SixA